MLNILKEYFSAHCPSCWWWSTDLLAWAVKRYRISIWLITYFQTCLTISYAELLDTAGFLAEIQRQRCKLNGSSKLFVNFLEILKSNTRLNLWKIKLVWSNNSSKCSGNWRTGWLLMDFLSSVGAILVMLIRRFMQLTIFMVPLMLIF